MSRTDHTPTYRKHKRSGQAVVTLPDGFGGRRDFYLGEHGTKESKQEYHRRLQEWEAAGRRLCPTPSDRLATRISVNELIVKYLDFAAGYYVKDGSPTSELHCIRSAVRFLKRLYGLTPARDFG